MTAPPPTALAGRKVLELGRLIADPFAAKTLADLGADVIEVEPPGAGDPLRRWRRNAPALGQDSVAVLREVGLTDELPACGYAKIEVTSFTSAKAIAMLPDTVEVIAMGECPCAPGAAGNICSRDASTCCTPWASTPASTCHACWPWHAACRRSSATTCPVRSPRPA